MKIVLRNLDTSTLNLDFTGYDVVPNLVSIPINMSIVVDTSLSVIEFRNIPDISSAISANKLNMTHNYVTRALN